MRCSRNYWAPSLALLAVTLIAAIIHECVPAQAQGSRTSEDSNRTCDVETLPALPDVVFKSVTEETLPVAHCKVAGVIGTETNFELLLPNAWNGKFVMGGGGGFVGSVVNIASDPFMSNADKPSVKSTTIPMPKFKTKRISRILPYTG